MDPRIGQIVGWGACVMCLAPIIILFALVRVTAFLERFATRHPLLLFLVPIAMARRAERIERETAAYCEAQNCQQEPHVPQYPAAQQLQPPGATERDHSR